MKEEQVTGIGLIGCGSMGLSVARRVTAIDPHLRVMAVYDPDERSVKKALETFSPRPATCGDYREILEMTGVEWVMIASWNCFHCEQTVASLRAGKHVFCQKPLAVNLDECRRMLEAWRESGLMFNIGFNLRYSPHYRKIRELVTDGRIGSIVSMEFNETLAFNHGGYIMGDWRRLREYAGSHLLEKCCHDIDLANWIVDSRPSRAASFGGLDFFVPENSFHIDRIGPGNEGQPAYRSYRFRPGFIGQNPFLSEKDIVDNQVVILEYENGTRATFHTNCNAAIPERRMYILGTEGAIRADVLTGEIELKRIGFETLVEDHSTAGRGGHGGGDTSLAGELAGSMLNNSPPSVGILEGVTSAVACFAADEAMEKGRVVDLAPMWSEVGL